LNGTIQKAKAKNLPSSEIANLIAKAEAGDPSAQRDLAFRLHNGEGVQQDYEASPFGSSGPRKEETRRLKRPLQLS
jgi:hypothetical protein